MKKQTNKKSGFTVSVELILLSTITTIGLIAGLVPLRDAVIAELIDTASAIESIDQSYTYQGITATEAGGPVASVSGSTYVDQLDTQVSTGFVAPNGVDTNVIDSTVL